MHTSVIQPNIIFLPFVVFIIISCQMGIGVVIYIGRYLKLHMWDYKNKAADK